MDCPICLNHIDLHNEAYLNPCFHRYCFTCIQQWTESQKRHPTAQEGASTFACPMCKSPYMHIIYDCIGKSYRLLAVGDHVGSLQAMPLTADQRRRRALYVAQWPAAEQGDHDVEQAVPAGKRAQPRSPTHPQTALFITRELQAILLEEDVDVIMQHVVGVLQNLANSQKQNRSRGVDVSPVYGPRKVYLSSVTQAVAGFLDEHAAAFAAQLWGFLNSGLNVAAYDALVFGEDEATALSDAGDDG